MPFNTLLVAALLCFGPLLMLAQQDSTSILLPFDEFIELVKTQHPIAKQADLQPQKGDADLLESRGKFDPKLSSNVDQKYFKDDQYYSLINAGLKVPTWLGFDLDAGFEQNQGVFLNPEDNVPQNGLWNGGISLPIGQGLFIDERRTAVRQAEIYQQSTQIERRKMLNDLVFDAGKAYWDWFMAYHIQEIYEEALRVASLRLEAVKIAVRLGDSPPIDTLEAGIQVQNRQLALQEAQLDFKNSSALLSIYLWAEGTIPLEVRPNTVPIARETLESSNPAAEFLQMMDQQIANHPELRLTDFKLQQLELERRWKQEQLKPQINLSYKPLVASVNGDFFSQYSINNYSWGIDFNIPLFLRKERGALQMTRLKIQETQLGFRNKQEQLGFKATAAVNEWQTTRDQINLYTQTVEDYQGLLDGERQLFETGESSLFLVNSRELGYINAQIKLVELQSKNQKAELKSLFALGQLGQ